MGIEPFSESDAQWMAHALQLAARAESEGEVPVGAVVVRDDQLIAEGWNRTIATNDPTGHAEIVALRRAGRVTGNYRMPDCRLYVTLEPCGMCISAVIHARLERLIFAASDPKTGALGGSWDIRDVAQHNHRIECQGGLMAEQAGERLRMFFRARR